MRSKGRDLRIAPRCVEALFRDRGIIVEMDAVVRDARVLRLALEYFFQDRRALELIGIGLVGRRSADVERKRIVYLRLVVVRIALGQLLHGLKIVLDTRAVVDLLMVGIHRGQRLEIVALALRF